MKEYFEFLIRLCFWWHLDSHFIGVNMQKLYFLSSKAFDLSFLLTPFISFSFQPCRYTFFGPPLEFCYAPHYLRASVEHKLLIPPNLSPSHKTGKQTHEWETFRTRGFFPKRSPAEMKFRIKSEFKRVLNHVYSVGLPTVQYTHKISIIHTQYLVLCM